MTALVVPVAVEEEEAGGRLVTRAKWAISRLRPVQGRVPRRPMPMVGMVAATMRVSGGRGMVGGSEVGGSVIVGVGESGGGDCVEGRGMGCWKMGDCN